MKGPIRVAVLAALFSLSASVVAAGSAEIVDGDTLRIGGVAYRLHGIDAPEKAQTCRRGGVDWLCGQEASAYLRSLVRDREVTCEPRDKDRYGRIVAACYAGGVDLGREMVIAGLAWSYRRYSLDYAADEDAARAAAVGVWSADAIAPWNWRRTIGERN